MKHIIKLLTPLFILLSVFTSCDDEKEWIYVTETLPGAYISGSATSYSAIAPAAAFRAADVDPDTDDRIGMTSMYTWLKADGEFHVVIAEAGDKLTTYGKGTAVSDITSELVADGPAYKVSSDGLYFLIYNSNLKQLTLVPVQFGIIGGATAGGWDGETAFQKVNYDEATAIVSMEGDFTLAKGEIKFRFNKDWGLEVPYDASSAIKFHTNMGGSGDLGASSITLEGGGGNLNVAEGAQYAITLDFNLRSGAFSTKAIKGEIVVPQYPSELYMIGADFGSWTWGSEGIVKLIPVHSEESTFWTIKYFTKANGFKWAPQNIKDNWDGSFTNLTVYEGFTIDGGNAFVPEDGLYMVYIDMVADKMVIEKPKVYGIGDAFGTWDAAQVPFTIEGNKMTITTTNTEEKNLRMHTTSSHAEGVAWWKMEFNVYDGKIIYRGGGGDQDAVPVKAGAKITLDFATDTAIIE